MSPQRWPDRRTVECRAHATRPHLHARSSRGPPTNWMLTQDITTVVVAAAAIVFLAVVFGVVVPRIRKRRVHGGPMVMAAFGTHGGAVPPRPSTRAMPRQNRTVREPEVSSESPPRSAVPPAITPRSNPLPTQAREAATGTDGSRRNESRITGEHPILRLESTAAEVAAGGSAADFRPPSLRVHRPMEGTLQFLAGRFEVIEGRDIGQEIRFVRVPGVATVEVTFGRGDGAPYRHVQLHEPTVSRLHAKMTLEGKRWRLTNMSKTNAVIVNLVPLEGEGSSQLLNDGDRVELGEVALRFRAK